MWGNAVAANGDSVIIHDRRKATGAAAQLPLDHAVDRIEALGSESAVIIGSDGQNLRFSIIALNDEPSVKGQAVRRGASQGETRTHGFFYKPQADGAGILGLPVRNAADPGWSNLISTGASVLFLRVVDRAFQGLGELTARDGGAADDCVASCTDWYGNSRPLFYLGRVFALLGYELVEGTVSHNSMKELQRVHLRPSAQGIMSPARAVDGSDSSGTMSFISESGETTEFGGAVSSGGAKDGDNKTVDPNAVSSTSSANATYVASASSVASHFAYTLFFVRLIGWIAFIS
jgi:hypothetical protein